MTRTHRLTRRIAQLVTSLALTTMLLSTVGAIGTAHAAECNSELCSYHAQGYSGTGAFGTGTQVLLPLNTYIPGGSYDAVAFNSFIVAADFPSDAVETGIDYGAFTSCQGLSSWYFPYGTLQNGELPAGNCNQHLLTDGSTYYYMQSWVYNGYAYSYITVPANGEQSIFYQAWGSYGMTDGWNVTQAEVHVTNGDPWSPGWSSQGVNMFHSKWMNASGNWMWWGGTNTQNDCPYKASYYSPDAWIAYSSAC